MVHEGDTLRDLKLNEDRQVFVGADQDLEQTEGLETVKQSAVLHAGNFLRPLVGQPVTAKRISRAETALRRALQRDPQLTGVQNVEIKSIDQDNNRIEVRVFTDVEHEFEIEDIL